MVELEVLEVVLVLLELLEVLELLVVAVCHLSVQSKGFWESISP